MTQNNANDIRDAAPDDREAIREVHTLAFAEGNEATRVATLACDLLDASTFPPTISLVVEVDSHVVAHVAFSPIRFAGGGDLTGFLLAPLAVRPDFQRRGLGARLVQSGVERLRGLGTDVVLVYGDPAYYGRLGFTAAEAERFEPPYKLEHPFGWLAAPLNAVRLPEQTVRVSCVGPLCSPVLWQGCWIVFASIRVIRGLNFD